MTRTGSMRITSASVETFIIRALYIMLFNLEIQVQVDKRITLAQLKEELVPLIGVPPTGFRVYGIINNEEYEMKRLDGTLKDIISGSKVFLYYFVYFLL